MGSPLSVYSRKGYKYAIEKTDFTYGWTKPAVDEFMSLGYVDEIGHFINCAKKGVPSQPGSQGIDGLKALIAVIAMYESAEKESHIKIDDFYPGLE